jgi:hypothetical protein
VTALQGRRSRDRHSDRPLAHRLLVARPMMGTQTLLVTILVLSLGCGGSSEGTRSASTAPGSQKVPAPPEEEEPEPQPAQAEPAPPQPDPQEEFTRLLDSVSRDVAAVQKRPFKEWREGAETLTAYDAQLAGFAPQLPDEGERIQRLRANIEKFAASVARKRKKNARQALGALEGDLRPQE